MAVWPGDRSIEPSGIFHYGDVKQDQRGMLEPCSLATFIDFKTSPRSQARTIHEGIYQRERQCPSELENKSAHSTDTTARLLAVANRMQDSPHSTMHDKIRARTVGVLHIWATPLGHLPQQRPDDDNISEMRL